jgi:hypothetical protein
VQGCRGAVIGAEMQRCSGVEMVQMCRGAMSGAELQMCRGGAMELQVQVQKCRGAEVLRCRCAEV